LCGTERERGKAGDGPFIHQREAGGVAERLGHADDDHLVPLGGAGPLGAQHLRRLGRLLADGELVARPGHAAAGPHAAGKGRGRVECAVGAVEAEGGGGEGRREVGEVVAGGEEGGRGKWSVEGAVEEEGLVSVEELGAGCGGGAVGGKEGGGD